MLNTQNNFHGFKAKASEVAHSLEGACLCGLFLAMTVAKPMGTLSQGIASWHADQGQPLLRSGGDLCSAFTSVPSTNTQTKGCPGRHLLHLHRQQPKHRLWASGIFVCFFLTHRHYHPVSHPHCRAKATALTTSCLQPRPALLFSPFTGDFIAALGCWSPQTQTP